MNSAESDPRVQQIQAGLIKIMRGVQLRLPVSEENDELDAIAFGVNVLVEQLHAEIDSQKALRSELDQVLSTMRDGLLVVDEEGLVVRANDTVARLMGGEPEDLVGRTFASLWVDDGTFSTMQKRMLTRGGAEQRECLLDAADEAIPVSISAAALPLNEDTGRRFSCTVHDLRRLRKLVHAEAEAEAERIRAEELASAHEELAKILGELKATQDQLVQAQKLDGLGRLAGGIAHDFNNLLAVILGSAELVQAIAGVESEISHEAENIVNASLQARSLTNQLLTFARGQPQNAAPFSVEELVEDTTRMVTRLLPKTVKWEVAASPGSFEVLADERQLGQVLMNLVVNARDAMPDGGTIRLSSRPVCLDQAQASRLQLSVGDYMAVELTDDGTGIADDVREKMFDPFFTTKSAGKGTGLGLAICYGIVRRAGGHIEVESEVGVGTTMRVYLPKALSETPPEIASEPRMDRLSGSGFPREVRLMVVDDEPGIRRLMVHALSQSGYQVCEACNGIEAVEKIDSKACLPTVLVTDIRMPKMGGMQLAELLCERDSSLRVLFVSGHTDEELNPRYAEGRHAFLAKPFRASDIRDAVATLLGTPLPQSTVAL